MYAPVLEIHTEKLTENAHRLTEFCAACGRELVFSTKGFCAHPQVIQAARAGGIRHFADSRMQNIMAAKRALPDLHYQLIRVPAPDEAAEVVRWADVSVQSDIHTIRRISDEAARQGRVHPILLMLDVGDLREGVFGREQLREIAPQIRECRGVELVGLGTNVGCYGSVLPSRENMGALVEARDYLNDAWGFSVRTLSAGGTCCLKLLEEGAMPEGVNQLRAGEAVTCGEDTTGNRLLEGYHRDAFILSAQVAEVRRKPSVPVGEQGLDAFGHRQVYPDRGVRLRAICAVGKQDMDLEALTPLLPGAEIIGASSDHLIVDAEDCAEAVRPGDWLRFRCGYMAIMRAVTSAYVEKKIVP